MATLISVYNSDGCIGRCDAKCYNAKQPGCDCVCGGKNHGAGLQQATENTRELADQWLDDFKKLHEGAGEMTGKVNPDIFQLNLFDK